MPVETVEPEPIEMPVETVEPEPIKMPVEIVEPEPIEVSAEAVDEESVEIPAEAVENEPIEVSAEVAEVMDEKPITITEEIISKSEKEIIIEEEQIIEIATDETAQSQDYEPLPNREDTQVKTNRSKKKQSDELPEARLQEPLEEGENGQSDQVDEQLFQDVLANSLDKDGHLEKEHIKKRNAATKASGTAVKTPEPQTIMNEFQSMVEEMFPSAKKEQIACTKPPHKKESTKALRLKQKKK